MSSIRKPQTARNDNMKADHAAGMSIEEVAKKYCMNPGYVQKVITNYVRPGRRDPKKLPTDKIVGLYADRDNKILSVLTGINIKPIIYRVKEI